VALEAVRISLTYMVPVVVMSDGYIANGAEPWLMPDLDAIPEIKLPSLPPVESFQPYMRDPETLARPWATPGTKGYEHRIGGLEKEHLTGNVSYDPANHQMMCELRAEKIQRIAQTIPATEIHGDEEGTLVLGWGSTYGAIHTAVDQAREEGHKVGHAHLRHINPFPPDLGTILGKFDRILVPEMNLGQLILLIREKFLVDAVGLNKIQGQPFRIEEIKQKIIELASENGA